MKNATKIIERYFERLGNLIYRRKYWVVAIVLALSAGLGSQLAKMKVDMSNEAFLHTDDPVISDYHAFKDQFGNDEKIIVAISTKDVFKTDFLLKLKSIHEDLENEVPYLEDVKSLFNVRNTRGEDGQLIIEDLLENWTPESGNLAELRKRVLTHPLYQNAFINENGTVTAILIKLEPSCCLEKRRNTKYGNV